jgi:hypothetical protein
LAYFTFFLCCSPDRIHLLQWEKLAELDISRRETNQLDTRLTTDENISNETKVLAQPNETATPLQISSSPSHSDKEDGCGVNAGRWRASTREALDVIPYWRPFDQDEIEFLREVEGCVRKMKVENKMVLRDHSSIKMLGWNRKVTRQVVRDSWIQRYQRIWFIGDSILEQQYNSMICMLDPKNLAAKVNDYPTNFTYNHSSGSTTLERTKWGLKFDKKETTLYKGHFPSVLKSATIHDAIIMNGGAHYDYSHLEHMNRALRFIANQSLMTNATIYYMEPTNEEWLTSNGMFQLPAFGKGCQQLDSERLDGQGDGLKSVPLSQLSKASATVVQRLYPELALGSMNFSNGYEEVALPAYWRSDLARSILLGGRGSSVRVDHYDDNKEDQDDIEQDHGYVRNNVHFVPVFWQLVRSNMTSNRNAWDCTHKSLDATLNMNFQLVRAMMKNLTFLEGRNNGEESSLV